ncbi:AbrB/MazE/SpoVT family DNA-binding domain-containing protein [Aneurinibacillus sp. REN35]|uniref:AbrB/MazE/SpoVT family DNA-binding domain-containing protein n=1 Tax=Aneurinibacillus sp. REN35 TaxID=3237286 RepID=UPI003528ED95
MRKNSQIKVDEDGSVVLPKEMMKEIGIGPRDLVEFDLVEDGIVSIRLYRNSKEQPACEQTGRQRVAEQEEEYVRLADKTVKSSE